MKYFAGDCIEVFAEIDSDKISGTALTLVSISDPNGGVITLNTAMAFGTDDDDLNIASATYQSDESALAGKYKYLVKSVNGSRINYAEGNFYIEDK